MYDLSKLPTQAKNDLISEVIYALCQQDPAYARALDTFADSTPRMGRAIAGELLMVLAKLVNEYERSNDNGQR